MRFEQAVVLAQDIEVVAEEKLVHPAKDLTATTAGKKPENSPAIYGWESRNPILPVPSGTADRFFRP